MSLNYGFGDDFDEIAAAAETFSGSREPRAPKPRQENPPRVGQEIVFGKSGMLSVKIVDKNGKERNRHPEAIDVIILDSKFGRQQWADVDGKPRTICATTKHSLLQKDGERKEVLGGWWQIPYGVAMANDRYQPFGSKVKPDGTLMSCVECVAAAQDGGCSNRGMIYIAIVGMSNEDGEMVALAKPLLATVKTPMASGIAYQLYIRRHLAVNGYRPNQVITRVTVGPTSNGLAHQLNFELIDQAQAEAVAEVTELFNENLEAFKQSEAERIEAWKASRPQPAGGFGAKASTPPLGAPKTKPAFSKPAPAADDELDF